MKKLFNIMGATGIVLSVFAGPVWAGGTEPTGCDDLSEIDEVPQVDFDSQIQPLFENCLSCHGGAAGLYLAEGESWDNLVGVPAVTNPDRLRVEPFEPEDSVLLLAVNCTNPGGPGFQMGNLSLADRALIRDWIAQGAEPSPEDGIFRDRFESE